MAQTPVGVHGPINDVVHDAFAFRLETIAEPPANDVLAVDRINGVVVGKFDGQQARGRQFVIELRQSRGRHGRVRHENIIDGGLDDVAKTVELKKAAAHSGPKGGRFEANFGAGVEDGAVFVGGAGAVAVSLAIMGEASADAWRNVEPAEESVGQSDLVVGVAAESFEVVGSGRGDAAAKIANRVFRLVVKRGRANLLAKSGEFEVGQ